MFIPTIAILSYSPPPTAQICIYQTLHAHMAASHVFGSRVGGGSKRACLYLGTTTSNHPCLGVWNPFKPTPPHPLEVSTSPRTHLELGGVHQGVRLEKSGGPSELIRGHGRMNDHGHAARPGEEAGGAPQGIERALELGGRSVAAQGQRAQGQRAQGQRTQGQRSTWNGQRSPPTLGHGNRCKKEEQKEEQRTKAGRQRDWFR